MLFLLLALHLSASSYASARVTRISPEFLFAHESKWVTFEIEAKELPAPEGARLEIIEVGSDGARKRVLGPLIDEGVFGDKTKGDGVYARRYKLSEETPGMRFFEARVDGLPLSPPARLELEIVKRPTFQEVLRAVWKKIFNPR